MVLVVLRGRHQMVRKYSSGRVYKGNNRAVQRAARHVLSLLIEAQRSRAQSLNLNLLRHLRLLLFAERRYCNLRYTALVCQLLYYILTRLCRNYTQHRAINQHTYIIRKCHQRLETIKCMDQCQIMCLYTMRFTRNVLQNHKIITNINMQNRMSNE